MLFQDEDQFHCYHCYHCCYASMNPARAYNILNLTSDEAHSLSMLALVGSVILGQILSQPRSAHLMIWRIICFDFQD